MAVRYVEKVYMQRGNEIREVNGLAKSSILVSAQIRTLTLKFT